MSLRITGDTEDPYGSKNRDAAKDTDSDPYGSKNYPQAYQPFCQPA